MDYQLIFVIKEYRHNKITTILNFCFIGMTVGLVVGILSKAIFDIILYPLMYFTFSCMFIGKD